MKSKEQQKKLLQLMDEEIKKSKESGDLLSCPHDLLGARLCSYMFGIRNCASDELYEKYGIK